MFDGYVFFSSSLCVLNEAKENKGEAAYRMLNRLSKSCYSLHTTSFLIS